MNTENVGSVQTQPRNAGWIVGTGVFAMACMTFLGYCVLTGAGGKATNSSS